VAVPAQKAAGVSKSYTGEIVTAPENESEPTSPDTQKSEEEETLLRARHLSLKTKINNNKI
jgi:hypothetical protein